MNFLNKILLSSWSFKFPNFIMFAQMVATGLFIYTGKKLGKFTHVPHYSIANASKCAPVSLIFSVNTVLALSALGGMNVPMYQAMRRCVPLAILILSPCLMKQETNLRIYFSTAMITFGAFYAASGDLDFDFKSYSFGCVSVFTQALYYLTVQKLGVNKDFSALTIIYINSVTCSPLMLFFTFLYGEHTGIWASENIYNPQFWLVFIFVVGFACMFSYSIFLSTTVNSALGTAFVGILKSAVTSIVGMYTFGGVAATNKMVVGQLTNFLGGVLYTYEKYQLKTKRQNETVLKR